MVEGVTEVVATEEQEEDTEEVWVVEEVEAEVGFHHLWRGASLDSSSFYVSLLLILSFV